MTPAKRKETRKKYEEMQKARKNERNLIRMVQFCRCSHMTLYIV